MTISIHALLAESDQLYDTYAKVLRVFLSTLSLRRATNINSSVNTADKISIHALLAESDAETAHERANRLAFLSTLSLRRATSPPSITPTASRNFYPRSPCGERPTGLIFRAKLRPISIHALLAESDMLRQPTPTWNDKFLSTLSLRRATFRAINNAQIDK